MEKIETEKLFISGVLAPMEDQSYVEEGYEEYAEDQQYEDYSNMGDGTELSKDVENAVKSKMYKDGVMWICTECNYQSHRKVHVFEHIEGKHHVHDGYFCQSCQQVFKTKAGFQRHYKNCQSKF